MVRQTSSIQPRARGRYELRQLRRAASIALLAVAAELPAQQAATVPSSSSAYERLESLSALVPGTRVQFGLRPLSRRDFDLQVDALAARVHLLPDTSAQRAWAERELTAIRTELGRHPARPLGVRTGWLVEAVASDAPGRTITSNGLGFIDATEHPLNAGRSGLPSPTGSVATVAPTIVASAGEFLAIVAQPRGSIVAAHGLDVGQVSTFHRAYVRAVAHNIAVKVGADEQRWGQSPTGSLFISGNAAPMPAIQMGSDTAFTLPWMMRLAGPIRWTVFVADLGRDQRPAHAKLAGWHVSMIPASRFEIGVSVLAQQGGEGGPPATLGQRIADLFPLIDVITLPSSDLQFSNKLAGGSLRLRFPELSDLDFYYELQMDDFDARRLRSSLVEDAGHLLGARLPLLIGGSQLAWRAEFHFTSLRLYEHTDFPSGVTRRDRIIGNPLGPNARGGYLGLTWQPSPLNAVELTVANERRDPSQYIAISDNAQDDGFRFVRVSDDPRERRGVIGAAVQRSFPALALKFRVRRDRAWRDGQPKLTSWTATMTMSTQRLALF